MSIHSHLRSWGFHYVRKLGEGTTSEVSHYRGNGFDSALKVSKVGYSTCLYNEYCLLKSMLEHGCLLPSIIDAFSMESKSFAFAIEYYPMTLLKYISSIEEKKYKLVFAQQICQALEHIHDYGIVHCDLKPANIVVDINKIEARLIDFGMAQVKNTNISVEVVTLWYRPIELLLGDTFITTAVDMWSFGCICYELFTNKHLFCANTESDMIISLYKFFGTPEEDSYLAKLPNFSKDHPKIQVLEVPDPQNRLEKTMRRCLRREPEKRISAKLALSILGIPVSI